MCCVASISFDILTNGLASELFKPMRGLRQGCPLFPLSFLFVIEGLSRTILETKRIGNFRGIKIVGGVFLSHLLFFYGILFSVVEQGEML
jgi:hypothetical protein